MTQIKEVNTGLTSVMEGFKFSESSRYHVQNPSVAPLGNQDLSGNFTQKNRADLVEAVQSLVYDIRMTCQHRLQEFQKEMIVTVTLMLEIIVLAEVVELPEMIGMKQMMGLLEVVELPGIVEQWEMEMPQEQTMQETC